MADNDKSFSDELMENSVVKTIGYAYKAYTWYGKIYQVFLDIFGLSKDELEIIKQEIKTLFQSYYDKNTRALFGTYMDSYQYVANVYEATDLNRFIINGNLILNRIRPDIYVKDFDNVNLNSCHDMAKIYNLVTALQIVANRCLSKYVDSDKDIEDIQTAIKNLLDNAIKVNDILLPNWSWHEFNWGLSSSPGNTKLSTYWDMKLKPPGKYPLVPWSNMWKHLCEDDVYRSVRASDKIFRSDFDQVIAGKYDYNGNGWTDLLIKKYEGIMLIDGSNLSSQNANSHLLKPLFYARNGESFKLQNSVGGWLFNSKNDKIERIGDFDGDGRDEIIITSPWGIGILKLSGNSLGSLICKPNGTKLGQWLFNSKTDKIEGVGNFNGDGHDDILISSSWGIGILTVGFEADRTRSLHSMICTPNGSKFGLWTYDSKKCVFKGVGDFWGARKDNILMICGTDIVIWIFVIQPYGSSIFLSAKVFPSRDWFDEFLLPGQKQKYKSDYQIVGVSKIKGSKTDSITIVSDRSAGILEVPSYKPSIISQWPQGNSTCGNQSVIALYSLANNKYVCARGSQTLNLVAEKNSIGNWERFLMFYLGNDLVALRSLANKKFVCAENRGASPLIANRENVGLWEKFELFRLEKNSIALKALANGKFVCAESGGNAPLIANRDHIDRWETFHLIYT